MITNRLELALETESDFESIFDLLVQIYPPEYAPTRDELQEEQKFYILMRKGLLGGRFGRWLARQKSDGTLIGLGFILPHLCTPEENASLPNGHSYRTVEVEVGWALSPAHRKQGFGTELGFALCHHALNDIQLTRVIGVTDTNNPESIHLMKRIGMEVVHVPNSDGVIGWVTSTMLQPLP